MSTEAKTCQACPTTTGLDTVTLVNGSTITLCRACVQANVSLIAEEERPRCYWCGDSPVTTVEHREHEDSQLVTRDACEDCGETMKRAAARAKRQDDLEARADYLYDMARDERTT